MKNFVLANISDVLSTLFGMQLGAIEVNPFLSSLMAATSVPEALLVKLALAAQRAKNSHPSLCPDCHE